MNRTQAPRSGGRFGVPGGLPCNLVSDFRSPPRAQEKRKKSLSSAGTIPAHLDRKNLYISSFSASQVSSRGIIRGIIARVRRKNLLSYAPAAAPAPSIYVRCHRSGMPPHPHADRRAVKPPPSGRSSLLACLAHRRRIYKVSARTASAVQAQKRIIAVGRGGEVARPLPASRTIILYHAVKRGARCHTMTDLATTTDTTLASRESPPGLSHLMGLRLRQLWPLEA